jgi:hypothetical protein
LSTIAIVLNLRMVYFVVGAVKIYIAAVLRKKERQDET